MGLSEEQVGSVVQSVVGPPFPPGDTDPTHHSFSSLLPGPFWLWYFGVEGQHKH